MSGIKDLSGAPIQNGQQPKLKYFNLDQLEKGKLYYCSLSSQSVMYVGKKEIKYYDKTNGQYKFSDVDDGQLFDVEK